MSFNKIFLVVPLKFWMGLSIVLMTICIVFVITLSNMAPHIQVIPQLFRFDPMSANQFIEATAINPKVTLKERKLIEEMLVRFYIENRHFYIPDAAELKYRYGRSGPIARLSAPEIYDEFIKSKGNYLENVQKALELINKNLQISIRRITVSTCGITPKIKELNISS